MAWNSPFATLRPCVHGRKEGTMRRILIVSVLAIAALGVMSPASATGIPEVRPFVGAFIPTGDQRDVMNDQLFMGLQGGAELAKRLHLLGTLAWAPRGDNKVMTYNYDAGVETFRPFPMGEKWEIRPFLGAGLGGRTYNDHRNNDHLETYLTWYGALGSEFQLDRFALRVEARDYMTRFEGLDGRAPQDTRYDIAVFSALAIHW
jgi:hypothetical protein